MELLCMVQCRLMLYYVISNALINMHEPQPHRTCGVRVAATREAHFVLELCAG